MTGVSFELCQFLFQSAPTVGGQQSGEVVYAAA
jgi:hypothetical protein